MTINLTPAMRAQLNTIFPEDYSDVWVVSDTKLFFARLLDGGYLNNPLNPPAGSGDMTRAIYDTDSNGIVDVSARSETQEDSLGLPAGDDFVLVSDILGNRSWVSNPASVERGGVQYDANVSYEIGDVVSSNNVVYIATAQTTGDTPPGTSWSSAKVIERGGLLWDTNVSYETGDVVSSNNVVYVATAVNTGDTPPSANWATPSVVELGGREWQASYTYVKGDIVTDGATGDIYIASGSTTGDQPTSLNNWAPLTTVEYGGRQYNATLPYSIGDIVTGDDGLVYQSITAINTGHLPSQDAGANWVVLATAERGGVAWDTTFKYLVGDTVIDGDVLYRAVADNDGAQPSLELDETKWAIVATAERGGVQFDATLTYEVNDTVIDDIDNKLYRCLTAGAVTQPSVTPNDWAIVASPERGGVQFDATLTYEVNDTVIDDIDNKLYRCLTAGAVTQPSVTPNDWAIVASPERGGVLWDTTFEYLVGDIVTDNVDGKIYQAIVNNNGNQPSTDTKDEWTTVSERGGILFNVSTDYLIGDIVTDELDGLVYRAVVDNSGEQPSADLVDAFWTIVNVERGGVLWETGFTYAIGDIVTDGLDGKVYKAITDNTAAQPKDSPTDWEVVSERGGVQWNTDTNYLIGDTVISPIDRKLYTAINDNSGSDPESPASTNWEPTVVEEKGGALWSPTKKYDNGDIVSDGLLPQKVFISISPDTPNVNNQLPITGSNTHWQMLDTIYYNAPTGGDRNGDGAWTIKDDGTTNGGGDHSPWLTTSNDVNPTTPNGLGQYPHTTLETIGARWRISGLGKDINGDSILWTFTTGTLKGMVVADHDTLTWVDGSTSGTPGDGSEIWLLTTLPRLDSERGGVMWRSGESYIPGDIVTDTVDGAVYVSIGASSGAQPSKSPLAWELARGEEIGGRFYKADVDYIIGDIITADVNNGTDPVFTEVYRCINNYKSDAGGNPTDFYDKIGNWELMETSPERGGVFYRDSEDYLVGDIITANDGTSTEVYRCITGYTSAAGGTPAEFNAEKLNWELVTVPERGGVFYKADTDYIIGDIISANNGLEVKEYRAIFDYTSAAGGAPVDFLGEIANWVLVGDERGGILWDTTTDYLIGDTVIDDQDNMLYRAVVDNAAIQPSDELDETNWAIVATPERGGVLWDITTRDGYLVGDIVTDDQDGLVYKAILDNNPGSQPSATPLDWELVNQERGGIAWAEDIDYLIGDTVTENELLFICVKDHTSALLDVVEGSPAQPAQTSWELVNQERGGVVWAIDKDYIKGDIVTENGILYICNVDHTSLTGDVLEGSPTQPKQANWIMATYLEKGGRLWNTNYEYLVGDIVTDDINDKIYKAILDNTGSQPSDPITLDWELVNQERGGVAWVEDTNYIKGDIVTENGITYICNKDHTSALKDIAEGSPLQPKQTSWAIVASPERGGIAWVDEIDYLIGDTVTEDGLLFICVREHTSALKDIVDGSPTQPLQASWELINIERGGVAWAEDIDYIKGDIVTEDGIVYMCNVNHTSVKGDVAEGSPKQYDQTSWVLANQERGGVAWSEDTKYKVGDIVTEDGIPFVCDKDHISVVGNRLDGSPLQSSAKFWDIAYLEKGGRLWDIRLDYLIGDIVTDDQNRKIYKAILDNTGSQPSDPITLDWELVNQERGGILWVKNIDYFTGDTVTEDGLLYICNTDHTSVSGDIIEGSPSQPAQDYWDIIRSSLLIEWFNPTIDGGDTTKGIIDAGYFLEGEYFIALADGFYDPTTGLTALDDTTGALEIHRGDRLKYTVGATASAFELFEECNSNLLIEWFDPTIDGGNDAVSTNSIIIENGGKFKEGEYFIAKGKGFYDFKTGLTAVDASADAIKVNRGDRFRYDFVLGEFELYLDSSDVVTLDGISNFPIEGEVGVIYVDANDDAIYRWDPLANAGVGEYTGLTKPGAIGNITTSPYKFNDVIVGDPGDGYVIIDNADPLLATEVSISNLDSNGTNSSPALSQLGERDFLGFIDDNSDTSWNFYITGPGVDNGTYWTFPIDVHDIINGDIKKEEHLHVQIFMATPDVLNHLSDVILDDAAKPALNKQGLFFDSLTDPTKPVWLNQDVDNVFEYYPSVAHGIPVLTALDINFALAATEARGVTAVSGADMVRMVTFGKLEATAHGLTIGEWQFLDPTNPGGYTNVAPIAPDVAQKLFYAIDADNIFVNMKDNSSDERGGVAWDANTEYKVGDFVYDETVDSYYKRIGIDPTVNPEPNTDDTVWATDGCICGYVQETGTAIYTPDFKSGNFFDYTMTEDSTFADPLNVEAGMSGSIVVRQDVTAGDWLATWEDTYVFPEGLPVLNPNTEWVHIFDYRCISDTKVVMEYVSSHHDPLVPHVPKAIVLFDATDNQLHQITFTWPDA